VPHYALPYLGPLMVFVGITLGGFLEGWPRVLRWAVGTAMILSVAAGTYVFVHAHLPAASSRTLQILESARVRPLDGKTLLAPQEEVSVLHYYFPNVILVLYVDQNSKERALAGGQRIDVILSGEKEPFGIDYLGSQ
jgi:hypothetical protein